MRDGVVFLAGVFLLLSLFTVLAPAQGIPLTESDFSMLAKAAPEECFESVGLPPGVPPCLDGDSKTNDAYIWSMTKSDPDHVWFGTNANTLCEVFGTYLGYTEPMLTDDFVCEFAHGPYAGRWEANTGDWRPPQVYRYNLKTSELSNLTDLIPETITTNTLGWRACATFGNFVIFAGVGRPINPTLPGFINMTVFDLRTGQHVASTMLPPYTDIRQFLVASDGNLYCGVQRIDSTPQGPLGSGRVLKWLNNPAHPRFPFAFEEVGNLDGMPANITEYNRRIWATTWPLWLLTPDLKPWGVYRSPVLPVGGLTKNDLPLWEKMWEYTMYDKDPLNGVLSMGGDLKEFQGWLYFGSMHIPLMPAAVAQDQGATDTLNLVVNGHRAISVFRLREIPGTPPRDVEVQCLWGRKELSVYNPVEKKYGEIPLPTGYTPLYGDSGFGNIFNNYTWSMAEYDGCLYIGTMDWSYLAESVVEQYLKTYPFRDLEPLELLDIFDNGWTFSWAEPFKEGILSLVEKGGGIKKEKGNVRQVPIPDTDQIMPGFDLMATDGEKWTMVTNDGFGENLSANYINYGLRNMVSDGISLFAGTANPMNIHPYGGWEFWRGSSVCSLASLKTDRIIYACHLPIEITLTDCDLDTSGSLEKVQVYISSLTEPNEEPTTLTETAAHSGVFTGLVQLSDIPTGYNDGAVMVADNDQITIRYQDADAGPWGPVNLVKTVPIDCEPPIIDNVSVEFIYQRINMQPSMYGALIRFTTKEHTFASVMYGYDCINLWSNASDTVDSDNHLILLRDLDDNTTYSFTIHVGDIAGNYAKDDNNGECHQFVTPPACEHDNISFDTVIYGCQMGVMVSMHDCAANRDPNALETQKVIIHAVDPENDEVVSSETLELIEDAFWPGVFTGSFMLDPGPDIPGDQVIQSAHNLRLIGTKVPDGISTPAAALALIDCQPPVISNVKVKAITETTAVVTFLTDEMALTTVDAGTSCGQPTVFGSSPPPELINHKVLLEFLTPGTTYYFGIMAQDLTMLNWIYDDNNGECYTFTTLKGCSGGNISFNRKAYSCSSLAFITVEDCGANDDPTTSNILTAYVMSDTETTSEGVTLVEIGTDSGVFEGFIRLSDEASAPGDGILSVTDGDSIAAVYHDPDDGTGKKVDATARAAVDCIGPDILSLDIVQILPHSALVEVSTSEPSLVMLDCATTCGLTQIVVKTEEFGVIHTLLIPGLTAGTRYYVRARMIDEQKNSTWDDNNGECYSFITPPQYKLWMLTDAVEEPRRHLVRHTVAWRRD